MVTSLRGGVVEAHRTSGLRNPRKNTLFKKTRIIVCVSLNISEDSVIYRINNNNNNIIIIIMSLHYILSPHYICGETICSLVWP